MKTSDCFRRILNEALLKLDATYPWYICVVASTALSSKDYLRVKKIINRHLCGHVSLLGWIEENHFDLFDKDRKMQSDRFLKKLHNTRIAWLKHLIEHYESIGD